MAKKTLNQLTREQPSNEELGHIVREVRSGNDRNSVILVTSHLQAALCSAIIARLPRQDDDAVGRLYENGAPLASFYSQIQLGYAMGLYEKDILTELNRIRNIRNAFAHALKPLNFATPEIMHECQKIKAPDILPKSAMKNRHLITSTRALFIESAIGLLVYLVHAKIKALKKKASVQQRRITRLEKKRAALIERTAQLKS